MGGDTYTTGDGSRLIDITYDEQVYGGKYIIDLDNDDAALDAKTYEGQDVVTYFGFVGETGSYLHKLKVEKQEAISVEGKLVLRLTCFDSLGKLSMYQGSVGGSIWNHPSQSMDALDDVVLPSGEALPDALKTAINAQYDKTGWEIIQAVITATINVTVTKVDDDGYINSLNPQVNAPDARSAVFQALRQTKSFLRPKTNSFNLDVIQPDAHATVYSFDTDNLHFSDVEERAAVVPNKIVFHGIDTDRNLISTGGVHGENAASIALLGEVIEHNDYDPISRENSTTQAEVDDKADARLAKLVMGLSTGTIVAPMHCSLELFDKVSITDNRYATPKTFTGYVFRIIREYNRGVYKISIQLGGVESGYTPSTGVDTKVSPTTPVTPPTSSYELPTGAGAYIADVSFTSIDYDDISWGAGTIKLADGRTQSIDAGSLHLTGTHYIYCVWGNSTLQSSTSATDATDTDRLLVAVASKGSSSSVDAYVNNPFTDSILINRDKVMDGLVDTLQLASGAVENVKLGYRCISDDKIATDAIISRTIATDAITAEKVAAGAITALKIDVATLDAIAANCGTLTAGIINGVTIYAGNEAVKLDSGGLTVYGQLLIFKNSSGTTRGYVYGGTSKLTVSASNGALLLSPGTGYNIEIDGGNLQPVTTNTRNLGHPSYRWKEIYVGEVNTDEVNAVILRPASSSVGGLILPSGTAKAEEGSIKIIDGQAGIYVYRGSSWEHIT